MKTGTANTLNCGRGLQTPMTRTMPNPPKPAGKSSTLRKGRVSEDYGVYSVTKVTDKRKPVLIGSEPARVLIESLAHLRSADRIKLYAFCVMPDHVHVAFCLMPGEHLSDVVGAFSKFTARRLNKLIDGKGSFWQEGFHDRHCRDRDELVEISNYIEYNPVRSGLVAAPEDWQHSSASNLHRDLIDREWWP